MLQVKIPSLLQILWIEALGSNFLNELPELHSGFHPSRGRMGTIKRIVSHDPCAFVHPRRIILLMGVKLREHQNASSQKNRLLQVVGDKEDGHFVGFPQL